jgi:hypothetical protein
MPRQKQFIDQHRLVVILSGKQLKKLETQAKKTNKTMSELIREYVDSLL